MRLFLVVGLLSCGGSAIGQPEFPAAQIEHPAAPAVKSLADLPATSKYGIWRPLGPSNFAGKVYDLAVDPRDANVVYAAYGSGGEIGTTNGGGLWRTRDGGGTWMPAIDRARDLGVLCVKTHPSVAGYVAAGLRSIGYNRDRGVLLSRDGGENWNPIGPSDRTLSVRDLALHPRDPDTLYAATQSFLLKTTDGGKTWKPLLSYASSSFWDDAPAIVMHPTDPETLLLCVRSLGVMRTADGGATWTRVDREWNPGEHITIAAWSPSDPNIVYAERVLPQRVKTDVATRQMATYRSTDAGRTWSPGPVLEAYQQWRYDMSIAVDPADPNHVIWANSGMMISSNNLKLLSDPAIAPHEDHSRVVFAPSDPKIVYDGTDGGVWKSTDRGFRWLRADRGVQTTHVFSFAVAPGGGNIYLSPADYDNLVYYPLYGWHNLDCDGEYEQFYLNPHDPADVYVGGKLHRVGSISEACTEIDPAVNENRGSHLAMAFDPVDANTLYLGLEHIWKSTDRGKHWGQIGINQEIAGAGRAVTALEVAPGDAGTLYALADYDPALWVSRDGGKKWSSGFPVAGATALAVSPHDAGTVYVGSGTGLYVSHDAGETGQLLENFPPFAGIFRIVIDPADPRRLFAGSNNGVVVSGDAGASWARLGPDMPAGSVVGLALLQRTLYASSNQGIWSMDLSGRAPCEQPVRVTPLGPVKLGSAGGTLRFDVDSVPGCPWTAATGADWADFHLGWASAELRVTANAGGERQATLRIAGQTVPLTQFGGPDPLLDGGSVTIATAAGCLTSAGNGKLRATACKGSEHQKLVLHHSRDLLYWLEDSGSPACLDITAQRQAGRTLYLYPCHAQDHQLFQFVPQADGTFSIWTTTGLQCLESRGDQVEQQPCNGEAAQRFRVTPPARNR